MTPDDAQQQRLLERLREAGDQPVAFAELHASGIAFPAAVVAELESTDMSSSASMTMAGRSACACSSQNPRTHPRSGHAGRTDSQQQYNPRITADDPGCEAWQRAQAARRGEGGRGFTEIVRPVQSNGNGRSCRSASVDWIVSAARRADDSPSSPALHGAGRAARSASSTLTERHGKVPASRRTAAGLRPALFAPLPKSASDWVHARGRFPQRSGTNAATPPMIMSPSVGVLAWRYVSYLQPSRVIGMKFTSLL
jgi:hypothetical protein